MCQCETEALPWYSELLLEPNTTKIWETPMNPHPQTSVGLEEFYKVLLGKN